MHQTHLLAVLRRDHRRTSDEGFDADVQVTLHDAYHLRLQNGSSQKHLSYGR